MFTEAQILSREMANAYLTGTTQTAHPAQRYTLYAIRCTKYAKQTQFPKGQNERKLTNNNEL